MKTRLTSQSRTASALVAVLITITILALMASSLVENVNNRRMTINQASAWQEALAAAEAGVHQGIAQLEQGVNQNSLPLAGPSPFPSATAVPTTTRVYLSHAGEGPSGPANSYADYTLTYNSYGANPVKPYYCIISTGTVALPGGKSLSLDSADAVLRKLNLQSA